MTIRLVSTTTSLKALVDRAPKRVVSKGDVVWAKSRLQNAVPQFGKPKGARVGSEISTFTLVTRSAGDIKVTATLPGGTVHAAGRVLATKIETIRVTGGAGKYANARGTATTRAFSRRRSRSLNVYRLQLP
jgi:hypothetical protein